MEATGDDHAVVGWQQRMSGHDVGLADLPRQRQCPEAARDGDGLMAVGVDHGGGKTLPVLLGQGGVNRLPLGLQDAPEDGIARFVRGGFQIIQGAVGLEGGAIGFREIEGGELDHLIRRGVIDSADQHADMAQGRLLDQDGCSMLPHTCRVSRHKPPGTVETRLLSVTRRWNAMQRRMNPISQVPSAGWRETLTW